MISRQTNYLKGAITEMKRLCASVISCVLILSLICSGLTASATTITGAVDTDNFVRGVDVSTLDMLEDLGARYYQNNVESDALTILKNNGANYVRLKLWVDPYKTFTNLPNGTYQFSIWAKTNGDQDVLQLYAKNYEGDELTTTITTSDINWNIFTIDEIVVTNNTLEIGVYTVAGADDWCNLDMAILRRVE